MKNLSILSLVCTLGTAYGEVVVLNTDLRNDHNEQSPQASTKTSEEEQAVETNQNNENEAEGATNINTQKKRQLNKKVVVHAILDLTLGNNVHNNDVERIDIYVAPSCLHCGTFLVNDLQDFLDKHSQNCFIRIRLLPVSAKDLFVMKIIQSEAKDMNGYYMIYLNYVRRTLATIKTIKPTEQQQALYKGSTTDPEMIKYQAIASAFGFSNEKIVAAIPDMDAYYEKAVMDWYRSVVKILEPFCPNKNLDLPLIIQNGKSYKNIADVPINQ